MKAICKKEIRGYLTSMTGYVCIAFMLVFIGFYFTAYNLQYAYPYFSITMSSVTFLFFVVIPILTMRILAEEKKQKTDQLLLTAPIKITDIVLGKYLAVVAVFAIPMLLICLYPILMSFFGDTSFLRDYTSILGFFLLGCAYLAIGMFISSVTESQIIAAVVSFAVLFISQVISGVADFFGDGALASLISFAVLILAAAFVLYLMTRHYWLSLGAAAVGEAVLLGLYFWKQSMFEGLVQKFLEIFNVSAHYGNFTEGVFDFTGVVYFLSIIVIALVLTIQSIQKRRWS